MKRLRGEKITAENVPAPFKTRSSGNPDIDLIAENMEKQNELLSDKNPYRLDVETDPFAPTTPSFFENKDNINSNKNTLPRPCKVPKPKPS